MIDSIKLKNNLQQIVSENIGDSKDEWAIYVVADILVDTLLGVINEELYKRCPKASTICYELW